MTKTFNKFLLDTLAKGNWSIFANSPDLVEYATSGIPLGIATHCKILMKNSGKTEIESDFGDLFRFTVKATERGQSVVITPEIEVLPAAMEIIENDEFDMSLMDYVDYAPKLMENDDLLKAIAPAMDNNYYDEINSEWSDAHKQGTTSGLRFNDMTNVAIMTAFWAFTILEILAKNKDATQAIEYEVPGFAAFTVEKAKKWTVKVTPDQQFKANVKSDALGDHLKENVFNSEDK